METPPSWQPFGKFLDAAPAGLDGAGAVVVWGCLISLRLNGRDLALINAELMRHRLGVWSCEFFNACI